MVVTGKEVWVAEPPLAVALSEFVECSPASLIDESSSLVDEIFDPFGLIGRWRRLLRVRRSSHHEAG
jgi:hypothetical protein